MRGRKYEACSWPESGSAPAAQDTDGARLRFVRWDATRGPRRGTVCLLGGRGEFVEKYFEVVADLRRRGACRDHGLARRAVRPRARQSPQGHVGSFEYDRSLHEGDRAARLSAAVSRARPSMGANVLCATRPPRLVVRAHDPVLARSRSPARRLPASAGARHAEIGCLLGLGRSYIRGGLIASSSRTPTAIADVRPRALVPQQGRARHQSALGLGSPRSAGFARLIAPWACVVRRLWRL